MILAIKSLLDVLTAFFNLRKEELVYRMLEQSEKKQEELISLIELERNKANEESAQRADFLFVKLQKEKIKYEKILANL